MNSNGLRSRKPMTLDELCDVAVLKSRNSNRELVKTAIWAVFSAVGAIFLSISAMDPTKSPNVFSSIGIFLCILISIACVFEFRRILHTSEALLQHPVSQANDNSQPSISIWADLHRWFISYYDALRAAVPPLVAPPKTVTTTGIPSSSSCRVVKRSEKPPLSFQSPIRKLRNATEYYSSKPGLSPISTTQELKSYLKQQQETETTRRSSESNCRSDQKPTSSYDTIITGAQPLSSNGAGQFYPYPSGGLIGSSSPQYLVMPRRSAKRSPYTGTSDEATLDRNTLRREPDVEAAWKLLDDIGLRATMQDYSDNTRRLLGQCLQDFIANFEQNATELMDCGVLRQVIDREMLVQPIFRPPGQSSTKANVSLSDMLIHFVREPLFQSSRRPGVNLLVEHKSFERFLSVRKPEHEAYVLSRIHTLSSDSYLGQARWDGGGFWKGKEWTTDLPSDSEVIMNVFCALMDGLLPQSNESDRPFRRLHFMESPPQRGTSLRGRYVLFQSEKTPPNYKVIVNGKVQEVLPGKNNCFHAIVLFLHAVKQQKSGHLGNINIHQILEKVFDI